MTSKQVLDPQGMEEVKGSWARKLMLWAVARAVRAERVIGRSFMVFCSSFLCLVRSSSYFETERNNF